MASAKRQLLVVERGAATPSRSGSEPVLLVQGVDEAPDRFAQRVIKRVTASHKAGDELSSLVMLTGPLHDAATAGARRLIALALAAHAATVPALQELRFEAQLDGDPSISAQLLSLADEIMSQDGGGRALPVRVTFHEKAQAGERTNRRARWVSTARRGQVA
jgi:hypothetical protein